MESRSITGLKQRRGFNLIEAAIVLGVVGAVIGGIWVAASAVNESWKTTHHIEQLQYITQKTLQLFHKVDLSSFAPNTYIEKEMFAAGVFPSDVQLVSSQPRNPWGGTMSIVVQNNVLSIRTRGLPYDACTKIFFAIAGKYKDNSALRSVHVRKEDDSVGIWYSIPLTITPAQSPCYPGTKSKFYFQYTP